MYAWARAVKPGDRAAQAFQALGSAASNSGFVGFPVAAMVVGASASLALSLAMVVENLVMLPLALTLAESARHAGKSRSAIFYHLFGTLVRNPLISAIALGAAASLIGVRLPAPLLRTIDMLAMTSGALALFAVGGALVGLQAGGVLRDAARIVAGKLLLHPLAVFAALLLFPGLDPELRKSMLILASAPMMGIYPLLGRSLGFEPLAAASLFAATALSFLTMSTLLLWL
jgi:predicted permease